MLAVAERVHEEVGEVWLLVNNAGVFLAAPFLESTPPQWEFILGVNLWGVVHGLQAFLPGMVARDSGHVVNTSSVDGIVTVPNATSYNAAKHAVTALSETLFRELEAAQLGGRRVGALPGRRRDQHRAVGASLAGAARAASGSGDHRVSRARRADGARAGRRHHLRGDRRAAVLDPHPPAAVRAGDARADGGHDRRRQPRRHDGRPELARGAGRLPQ